MGKKGRRKKEKDVQVSDKDSRDLKTQTKEFDFDIVSQTGKKIPCHKFELSKVSPVFDAMLKMKESKEVSNGCIEIIDVSDQALEAMVKFIYANYIQEDEDVCQDLLILANKYDLKNLADKIIPEFVAKLDVDNCVEGYVFGFLHRHEKIHEAAYHIVISEWEWLQKEKKEELQKFSELYPKEFKDLREKISRNQLAAKKANIHVDMHYILESDSTKKEPFEKDYRVGEVLDKRGFGTVYASIRVCDGKEVSIKHVARTKVTEWEFVSTYQIPILRQYKHTSIHGTFFRIFLQNNFLRKIGVQKMKKMF